MRAVAEELYVRSASGLRMYVDPDDARAHELRQAEGSLNPGSARVWDAALAMRSWDVVVDVGANYGEMVLGSPMPPGARLVCFEPNPRVLPYLRRSVEEAPLEIDLRAVAIGARAGEATFVMDTVWSGRSGLERTHRTDADHRLDSVVVPVRTLDSELVLADDACVCVKVDVEGGEFDVLDGARDLVGRRNPWAVMMEVLHMTAFEQARLANEFTMSVMDVRSGELVVVPPASPRAVSTLLRSGWLYPQDAVLTPRRAA